MYDRPVVMQSVEWEVRHPLSGEEIAIVRLIHLEGEPYYRAVTANPDRAQRKLVGYWGSAQDAHDGVLAILEAASRRSITGGNQAPSMPLVPQKPPPGNRS